MVKLSRVGFHPLEIGRHVGTARRKLTSVNTPHQGAEFVSREIKIEFLTQVFQQRAEQRGRGLGIVFLARQGDQPGDLRRDFFRGEHMVRDARLDCGTRHPVILCGFGFLHQGETTCRLNGTQAGNAVRARPGQHDADRGFALFGRQRDQELVDRGFRDHFG